MQSQGGDMKKLYKLIDLKSPWYLDPVVSRELYFPSISQLRDVNDPTEFTHDFDTHSPVINQWARDELSRGYSNILGAARILCLSQSFNKENYGHHCPNGGVVYEFGFDESSVDPIFATTTPAHGPVAYRDRETNASRFLIKNSSREIQRILYLSSNSELRANWSMLSLWLDKDASLITQRHIIEELVFAKDPRYKLEDEYRFICNNIERHKFETLGLRLVAIHTDATLPPVEVPVNRILF
jgi:hypothetical protein